MTPKKNAARPMVALLLIIALLASAAITASPEVSAQELPTLSGTVTAGGVPLDGLLVTDIFGDGETTTDSNGDFAITVDDAEFAPLNIEGEQTADRPSIDLATSGEVSEDAYDASLSALGRVELSVIGGPYTDCSYNAAVLDGCVIDEFCTAELAADGLCDEVQIEIEFGLESVEDIWAGSAASTGNTVDRSVDLPVFGLDGTWFATIAVTSIDGTRYQFAYDGDSTQTLDLGEDVRTRVTGTLTAGGEPLANLAVSGSGQRTASDGSFSYSEAAPAPFDVRFSGDLDRAPGFFFNINIETTIDDPATELPLTVDVPAIVDLEVEYVCPAESCGTQRFSLDSEMEAVFDSVRMSARSTSFGRGNVVPVFAAPATITINDANVEFMTVAWDGVSNPLIVELPESKIITVAGTITAGGVPLVDVEVDRLVRTNEEGQFEFQTVRSESSQRLDVASFGVNPTFVTTVGYSHGDDVRVEVNVDLPSIVDLEVQLEPICDYAEAIVAGCALEDEYFVAIQSGFPELADGDFGGWASDGQITADSSILTVFDVPGADVFVVGDGHLTTTTWDGSNPFVLPVSGVIVSPEPKEVTGTVLAGGVPLSGIAVGRDVTDEFGRFTTVAEGELRLFETAASIAPSFDLSIPVPEGDDEITIELPEIIELEIQVNTTCLYNRAIIEGCAETGTASLFGIEINTDLPSSPGGSGSWSIFDAAVDGVFTAPVFTSDFTVFVGEQEGDIQAAVPWDGSNPFIIDPVEITGTVQTEDGVPVSGIELVGPSVFDPIVSGEDGSFRALVPPRQSELVVRVSNSDSSRPDVPGFDTTLVYYPTPGDDILQVVLPRVIPVEIRVNDPDRPAFIEVDGEFTLSGIGVVRRADLGWTRSLWEYTGVTTNGVYVAPTFDTGFTATTRAKNLEDETIIGNAQIVVEREGPLFVDVKGPPYFWYRDRDGDLYGNPEETLSTRERTTRPNGYAAVAGDCDDTNAAINPRAEEVPANGIDENCDGLDGDPVAMCLGSAVTIDMRTGASGVGTDGDDVILGTSGPDVIMASGGDDKICSGAGDDTINAGAGDDIVAAGAGNDRIFGLSGADDLRGWTGEDLIRGGYGADVIDGGPDDDDVWGQAGDDVVRGGTGDDVIRGNRGNDTVSGQGGDDEVDGGPDVDIIRGGLGDDTLIFEPEVDAIVNGGAGNNTTIPK